MNLRNKKQIVYLTKDKPKKRTYKKRAKALDHSLEDAEPLHKSISTTKSRKDTNKETNNITNKKSACPNTASPSTTSPSTTSPSIASANTSHDSSPNTTSQNTSHNKSGQNSVEMNTESESVLEMSYSVKTNSSKTTETRYTESLNSLVSNQETESKTATHTRTNSINYRNFVLVKQLDSQEDVENYLQNKFFYTRITHSQKTKCSSEACQRNSPHDMRLMYSKCNCNKDSCKMKLKIVKCDLNEEFLIYKKSTHKGSLNLSIYGFFSNFY